MSKTLPEVTVEKVIPKNKLCLCIICDRGVSVTWCSSPLKLDLLSASSRSKSVEAGIIVSSIEDSTRSTLFLPRWLYSSSEAISMSFKLWKKQSQPWSNISYIDWRFDCQQIISHNSYPNNSHVNVIELGSRSSSYNHCNCLIVATSWPRF